MIEGFTYQSKKKFSASLYALEVKSRFIDQKHADGFYKGFGEELSASATGNVITLGTGAFLVQGRMNIVTESERVVVSAAHAGKKGMLVAHINTFQPDTGEYCVLQTFFDTSVEAIKSRLKHENTYEAEADTSNRVYELPLFAFDVGENGTVSNLVKEIKPIEDYATVKSLYDEILAQYKAHNEEMKKIKDEIVSRQGTIVTSGGQNLLSFDADKKADKTEVDAELSKKVNQNSLSSFIESELEENAVIRKRRLNEDTISFQYKSSIGNEIYLWLDVKPGDILEFVFMGNKTDLFTTYDVKYAKVNESGDVFLTSITGGQDKASGFSASCNWLHFSNDVMTYKGGYKLLNFANNGGTLLDNGTMQILLISKVKW